MLYLMRLDYVDNLSMLNVSFTDGRYGVYIGDCDNFNITNCTFKNNTYGNALHIDGTAANVCSGKVIGCLADNSGEGGFGIYSGIENANISSNLVINCSDFGFSVGAQYCTFTNNQAIGNGSGGVNEAGFTVGGDDNVFSGNIANGNNQYGFHVTSVGASRNVFTGNRATGNTTSNFDDNGTNTTDSGNDWN